MSMIREIGEAIGDSVVESVGRAVGRTQEQRPLPADLLESEEAFLAIFDAPGVEQGDVQARFESGEIHVRVDRFREFHEGFEMRFPGRGLSLGGSVSLPDGASAEPSEATATLKESGTVHVRVPKAEPIDVHDEGAENEQEDED
ncbi:MAG: Hsp20/alpha crystallin family protein [Haloarculaceae archaeon]